MLGEIVEKFPDDRKTEQKYWVAYDNTSDPPKFTGSYAERKEDAGIKGEEGIKGIQITVNPDTDIRDTLQAARSKAGLEIKNIDEILPSLVDHKNEFKSNKKENEAAPDNRKAELESWNYDNVWVPASDYAIEISTEGENYREKAAQTWNDTLPDQRQELADSANALGDLVYTQASALNNWNKGVVDWAKDSATGTYTSNRAHIYDHWGADLADIATSLNEQATGLGLDPLITQETYDSMLTGAKNAYGAYYGAERVPI